MALLSVIIPSFNEESNIRNTVDTLSAVLQREHIAYELLFVSDGSKDQTFPLIRSASLQDNRVRGVQFSRNFGKEAAIFAGLRLAEGDCCVVIDCDLQHPPETIPRMYRLWEQGYEVVEGIKSSRGREKLSYKLSSGVFYKLLGKLTGVDMSDSSDFKLLDRKVVDVLNSLPERNTFFRALSFWAEVRPVEMVAQGVVEIRRFQHHLVFLRAHAAGDGAWDPAAHPVRGVGRPDTREILHPSGGGGVYDGDPPFTHHRRGADDEPRYHRLLHLQNLR